MKTLNAIAIAGLVAGYGLAARADEKHAAPAAETVKGEVVDLSCYLSHGAKGAEHKKCAQSCAKKGLPLGVLTADGKLYLALEDHGKAAAYKKLTGMAAETVSVTGTVFEKEGIRSVQVQAVAK